MKRQIQEPTHGRVFAFLVALMVCIIPGTLMAQSAGQRGIGIIEFIDGEVSINGIPADFGQIVEFGDWVQTGPDSSVDIVFDRANIFRLGQNTVAAIEIGATRQSVDLKFGSFAAVFDRLRTLTGNGTFDVRTPTASAGVRGTTFFFRVFDRDLTYVCACNGTLELEAHGSGDSFLDSAVRHSAHYFREVDGTVVVEVAPETFHSSESLNAVADQIGVTIPWGSMPE